MNELKVIQLGEQDLSKLATLSDKIEWCYEPDFSSLDNRFIDALIIDREVNQEEYEYYMEYAKAYCVFTIKGDNYTTTNLLVKNKCGKTISRARLKSFLLDYLPDYFSRPYGEKFSQDNMAVAQGFAGKIEWKGFEGIELEGDFGEELTQIVYWRNNIPIENKQTLEYWLEYEKDDSIEISLCVTMFSSGSISEVSKVWNYSEEELKNIVFCTNNQNRGYLFVYVKAKGSGRLKIVSLHDRYSRNGKGIFLPGGNRKVSSNREEAFYYFDPCNYQPPLNVYFSGFKTQEGFEGYNMLKKMNHPFLLISDSRLEGGSFYLGDEEYENNIVDIIEEHMQKLGFDRSQVILSGLSMGTFGALYYGCRIRPNSIIIGKPLASLGDVAKNETLTRTGGFPTSLDVLHKMYGSLDKDAIDKLNNRFWNAFDTTDWGQTRFVVSYMIEDDYDANAYANLQAHLNDAGARIYGKGLHGRHNDNTSGIVNWFVSQYKEIIKTDFEDKETEE